MKEILKNLPALLVLPLILGVAQGAFAQVDPPDRVARLNFIEGAVSYLPSGGDQNDWVAAVMNRPLTTGDRLWSRADTLAKQKAWENAHQRNTKDQNQKDKKAPPIKQQ
jgi:hypothetical protein